MKIVSLSSSSKGNCIYLENENVKFLIDFGLSLKNTEEKLKEIGKSIEDINFIIITHEHLDHSKGLKTLVNKYSNIKIILTNGTYQGILEKLNINNYNFKVLSYFENLKFDNLDILLLPNNHDANEPSSICIYENKGLKNEKKYIHCTDTGFIKEDAKKYMYNADIYLIEANYDYSLLYKTQRPIYTKNRINSDYGHLSNDQATSYINEFMSNEKSCKWAILHISSQANEKELIERSIIENIKNIDKIEIIFSNLESAKVIEE